MKKQTAVEWLMNQIMEGSMDTKTGDFYIKLPKHSFEQAKAMEREQMMELISFVKVHNKMGKSVEDLLQQFETYKGGEQ